MTLYDMTTEAYSLLTVLEATDLTDEEKEQILKDNLDAIGADEKLDSYGKVIRQLECDANACKAEIERLTEQKKTIEKAVDRMKVAVGEFMTACGKEKEQTDLFRFSFRKSVKVVVDDLFYLPEKYIRKVVKEEADKTAIKEAILRGEAVKGAELKEERKVQIK